MSESAAYEVVLLLVYLAGAIGYVVVMSKFWGYFNYNRRVRRAELGDIEQILLAFAMSACLVLAGLQSYIIVRYFGFVQPGTVTGNVWRIAMILGGTILPWFAFIRFQAWESRVAAQAAADRIAAQGVPDGPHGAKAGGSGTGKG